MKCLTIVIPTFNGKDRLFKVINNLKENNFFNCDDIHIHVIENPSENLSKIKNQHNISYECNSKQIGFDGSWFKGLKKFFLNTEWILFLGDDDLLDVDAFVLVDLLKNINLNYSALIVDVDVRKLIKFSRKDQFHFPNGETMIPMKFRDSARLLSLDYGFSFISNTFFRPNIDIYNLAKNNYERLTRANCIQYYTLFPYHFLENKSIMILLNSNLLKLGVLKKSRSPNSKEHKNYIKKFKIDPKFYNFVVWIKCGLDLESFYKSHELGSSLVFINKLHTIKSFLKWISSSKSFGIFYVIKLIFYILIGNKDAQLILSFIINNLGKLNEKYR